MTINWPSTLPARPSSDGYSETLPNNLIRTQMDVGPAKVRRRTTTTVRRFTLNFYLTQDEVAILKTFYEVTLAYGALAFVFNDPRTQSAINLRIITPPKISHVDGIEYRVEFEAEQIP